MRRGLTIVVFFSTLLILGTSGPASAQRVRAPRGKRALSRGKRKGRRVERRTLKRMKQTKGTRKAISPQAMRRNVGVRAASRVRSGQVVGLGTGRTATEVIRALGERVKKEGLDIVGVATSKRTAELARKHGIKVVEPGQVRSVDVAIDGADEVDPSLDLVKGLGGALLREKQVAKKAKHFIIVVDEGKIVSALGRGKIPVEVLPKTSHRSATWLRLIGGSGGGAILRRQQGGKPYVTDNKNYIIDLKLGPGSRQRLHSRAGRTALARRIEQVPGVVDHGLFLGMTSEVMVGREDGSVQEIKGGSTP